MSTNSFIKYELLGGGGLENNLAQYEYILEWYQKGHGHDFGQI